jgi:hypothetical protein
MAEAFEVSNIKKITREPTDVLEYLLKKNDIFFSKRTGGGKSFCYQAFPMIYEETNNDKHELHNKHKNANNISQKDSSVLTLS